MAEKLTQKQRGYVMDVAKGLTGTQAALNNYETESYGTAAVISTENLKKPNIVEALEEALPKKLLDQVHREGLFATKPVFTPKGELVAEEADFNVRAKYLDMAYKRKGEYAAEKRINLNVEVEASDKIKELAKKLNK